MLPARRPGCRARLPAGSARPAARDENSDAAVAAEFTAAEAAAGQHGPLTWYGDSAYGTGELRAAVAAAGHRAVIKPKPLLPAVPGGFTADDFAVDAAAGTVTCPAGITRHITPPAVGHLRDCLPRLSAPPALHHRQGRPHRQAARTRQPAPRRPRGLVRPARGLQGAPAEHRARRRPGHRPARPPPQAPLPRRHPERRLAQDKDRRPQPPQPHQPRPHPPRRHLGPGHLTSGTRAGTRPRGRQTPQPPAGLLRTSHGQPTAARQAHPPPCARVPRKPPRPRTLPNSAAS